MQSFLALYHTYIHTRRTYTFHRFYTRICHTLHHLFLKQCGIFSSDAVSSSIALHFSVKDVSVVFISCLVSVVLDVHCIFFPWTWSFFLSILEFLLVALLLWLFYCLIGHLKENESETRFWACLKKTACIHTILRF